MARKTRLRVPLGPWDGGLNEDEAPNALEPNQLRVARNVQWHGRALGSRDGSDRLQTTAIDSGADGVGVWQLERSQSANRDNVAVFGSKMYKDAKSNPPTDITGAVTITAGANNLVQFTHFNDLAIMSNGVNSPWKWTGSGNAAALGGTPPLFNTSVAKWNRLFGGGIATSPRTGRFSAVGDPENWPAANTVAAILGDSSSAIEGRDFIYQFGHLGDAIFVGLQNSIGRILYTGDATTPFRYNQLAEFGCEGAHSYVAVGHGGYFLSRRGVHYIKPSDILITYETSMISGRRIATTWDTLNKARIKYTYGTLFRTNTGNIVVLWPLSTGGSSSHDIVLLMDITEGPGKERFAWWTGIAPNAMATVVNPTTNSEELLFVTLDGFVWQGDIGTGDEGAAIDVDARTRWEDFGSPADKKNLRDVYIEASIVGGADLNLESFFNYGTTSITAGVASSTGGNSVWDTAVWDTDVWSTLGITQGYITAVGDGHVVSHRLFTNSATTSWILYKLVPAVEAIGEAKEA